MLTNSLESISSPSCDDSLFQKLDQARESEEKGVNESFMTLNLEFDFEDKKPRPDAPRTLSLTEGGFEMQDTTGGTSPAVTSIKTISMMERAIQAAELGDSSDSEEDTFVSRETKPLVQI